MEPISFNRGFYTVDVRYFYYVTAEAFVCAARPVEVAGLCVFDKRVILFGSEGSAKVFTSTSCAGSSDVVMCGNLPVAVVEAVDPIVLNMKLVDVCDCRPCDCEISDIPAGVFEAFDNELYFGNEGRRAYITLGQFSIIRLERDTQLLIPAYDYDLPDKECDCSSHDDDPCEIFRHVKFPVDEFFPPNGIATASDNYRDVRSGSR